LHNAKKDAEVSFILSSFPGSVFEADMGFDAKCIFKKVFDDVP